MSNTFGHLSKEPFLKMPVNVQWANIAAHQVGNCCCQGPRGGLEGPQRINSDKIWINREAVVNLSFNYSCTAVYSVKFLVFSGDVQKIAIKSIHFRKLRTSTQPWCLSPIINFCNLPDPALRLWGQWTPLCLCGHMFFAAHVWPRNFSLSCYSGFRKKIIG